MENTDSWPAPEGDSYDRLAPWYQEDMGASMRFDDIAFYRGRARARGGRTLEIGCGTGRILRPLAASGVAMSGIDRSAESLRRLAEGLQQECPLAHVDVTRDAPPAWLPFDTILLPYSIITYWTNDAQLTRAWAFIASLSKPGTQLVIDAFLPRPMPAAVSTFSLDYERQTPRGTLSRWKRITPQGDGCNRIERRYQIVAHGETERFQTVEVIHPWRPEEIVPMAQAAGFALERVFYDYGQAEKESEAQFVTQVFIRTQGQ